MNRIRTRGSRLIWVAVVALLVYAAGVASASLIGSLVKVGGIGMLVSKFGPDINKGFNKLAKIEENDKVGTKVVPVVSVGKGTSVGAVQVTGSPQQVDKVEAVLQIEGKVLGLQIRALIPSNSKNPAKFNRVEGVGVSGIVDVKV